MIKRKQRKIKPVLPRCIACGKKNINHHFFCSMCWNQIYLKGRRVGDSKMSIRCCGCGCVVSDVTLSREEKGYTLIYCKDCY
jgi:hypothetical protein